MLSLYGCDEVIRNLYKISQSILGDRPTPDTDSLRRLWLESLSRYQPYLPVNRSEDLLITDGQIENGLIAAYSRNSNDAIDDLDQQDIIGTALPSEIEKSQKLLLLKESLVQLLRCDEEVETAFPLAIHSIFFRGTQDKAGKLRAFGGSSGGAIGVIWIGLLNEKVRKLDIVEIYIHELTHHLLFIDELCHPHFDYSELVKKDHWAYSAILNKHRPLDKVVHSIVVATELVLARSRYAYLATSDPLVHPKTSILLREVNNSCQSVFELPGLAKVIKPRTLQLVERCASICRSLADQFESVAS